MRPTSPFRPRLLALASVVTAALLVSACSGGDTAASDTAAVPATPAPAATPAAPALGDAEVAHIAVTANAIDSAFGADTRDRLTDADAKAFARMMATDHAQVNAQAVALATRLGVTPVDNDVSRSLQQGATQARDGMRDLTGAALDRAYIDREVAYHQSVIEALDGTLVPNAQNAELKKLLQDVRPAFVAHLERAKAIQARLAAR